MESKIDFDGVVTASLSEAKCAKEKVTGNVWQLFSLDDRSRFQRFSELAAKVKDFNASSLCGVTTWKIPDLNELGSLLPLDESIFTDNTVDTSHRNYRKCYVSSEPGSGKTMQCFDLNSNNIYEVDTIDNLSLYRLYGN